MKGLYDVFLKAILEVHDVVWDAEALRHPSRIIDIVQRTTPPRAMAIRQLGETPLVPQLHRHPTIRSP
jgi:hypothetical protein